MISFRHALVLCSFVVCFATQSAWAIPDPKLKKESEEFLRKLFPQLPPDFHKGPEKTPSNPTPKDGKVRQEAAPAIGGDVDPIAAVVTYVQTRDRFLTAAEKLFAKYKQDKANYQKAVADGKKDAIDPNEVMDPHVRFAIYVTHRLHTYDPDDEALKLLLSRPHLLSPELQQIAFGKLKGLLGANNVDRTNAQAVTAALRKLEDLVPESLRSKSHIELQKALADENGKGPLGKVVSDVKTALKMKMPPQAKLFYQVKQLVEAFQKGNDQTKDEVKKAFTKSVKQLATDTAQFEMSMFLITHAHIQGAFTAEDKKLVSKTVDSRLKNTEDALTREQRIVSEYNVLATKKMYDFYAKHPQQSIFFSGAPATSGGAIPIADNPFLRQSSMYTARVEDGSNGLMEMGRVFANNDDATQKRRFTNLIDMMSQFRIDEAHRAGIAPYLQDYSRLPPRQIPRID